MPYVHGVTTSEKATALLPPVMSDAGIPFVVGMAPVNMTDPTNVNKPVLCSSYAEAVAKFGYAAPVPDSVSGKKKHEFTISEFIQSQFALFQAAPVVIVNVLDPATHYTAASTNKVKFDAQTATFTVEEKGIILSSVKLGPSGSQDDIESGKFTAAFDDDGNLVLSANKNAQQEYYYTLDTDVNFAANKLDPSAVTDADIIGGITSAGVRSGFELVEEVFPRFRVVPGTLVCPWRSQSASVAAVMAAKATKINEVFAAGAALIDAPTSGDQAVYSGVAAWKNTNNVMNKKQVVCWPRLNNDGVIVAMSTQLAGLIQKVDGENEGVPYVSPSNNNFVCTGTCLENGNEVFLTQVEAANLNGNGVVTALNFIGGWKCWGNRTAIYPANTDPKDSFIPVARMFTWVANTLVQNYWSRLDFPITRRQIDTILDSVNLWLNGMAARQYILGGRVEFMDTENSTLDLMDGILRFHVFLTPPSPNREIDFILEYDPEYLSTLFS